MLAPLPAPAKAAIDALGAALLRADQAASSIRAARVFALSAPPHWLEPVRHRSERVAAVARAWLIDSPHVRSTLFVPLVDLAERMDGLAHAQTGPRTATQWHDELAHWVQPALQRGGDAVEQVRVAIGEQQTAFAKARPALISALAMALPNGGAQVQSATEAYADLCAALDAMRPETGAAPARIALAWSVATPAALDTVELVRCCAVPEGLTQSALAAHPALRDARDRVAAALERLPVDRQILALAHFLCVDLDRFNADLAAVQIALPDMKALWSGSADTVSVTLAALEAGSDPETLLGLRRLDRAASVFAGLKQSCMAIERQFSVPEQPLRLPFRAVEPASSLRLK